MGLPIEPTRSYRLTAIALYVLLLATIATAKLPLGGIAPVIALTIAGVKAVLVALIFMHLSRSSHLTRLFAVAGLGWLAMLIGASITDVLTRP